MKDIEKYKIITIQARSIYDYAKVASINNESPSIVIRDNLGKLDTSIFDGYLDRSLETEKLQEVYKNTYQKDDRFCININDEYFTTAVIAVRFDFVENLYNKQKSPNGEVYIKNGYKVDFNDLVDHIIVKNGEIIAIEVPYSTKKMDNYKKVEHPINKQLLGKYFRYSAKSGCYLINEHGMPFPIICNKKELREQLYRDGFICDNKHYVRYKRSAGSSREGHCLFIQEALYDKMMQWTECGINKNDITDLASWEAYISLTLSNMQKKIKIPLHSILFVRDYHSVFNNKVVSVKSNDCKDLIAVEEETKIDNNIWDGESLLDESIFKEYGYSNKGMMLLRNNFFKTCAFNCKITKWLEDNNITKISQLNGFTTARKVEDIKLIVTDSSIKYLKLVGVNKNSSTEQFNTAIKEWLHNIEPYFGVVKTDKPTAYFNGEMVQTTYQILNTLSMSDGEIEELLKPTIDYLLNIRKEPIYMRYYLKNKISDDFLDDIMIADLLDEVIGKVDLSILKNRFDAVLDTMKLSEDFTKTKIYADLRKDVSEQIKDRIKLGKILIEGTYATLFGNGAELLKYATDKNYVIDKPLLNGSEIYNKRFKNNEVLFAARSPHITMGNILVATNKYVDFYDKYFNLSNEIVCVNSINYNVLQRLNGCDFDSDTMLISNNKIIVNSAQKNYNNFLVPTCQIDASKIMYKYDYLSQTALDKQISDNKIGEIVNLSQYLNSILWHKFNTNADILECKKIYLDICKLAVLSGIEIDSAKKSYDVNKDVVIDNIKKIKKSYVDSFGTPLFYTNIQQKSHKRKQNKKLPLVNFYTTMEQIYNYVSLKTIPVIKGTFDVKVCELLDEELVVSGSNDYKYKQECLLITEDYANKLRNIQVQLKLATGDKTFLLEKKAKIYLDYFNEISKKLKTTKVIKLLLEVVDSYEINQDDKRVYYKNRSLLFSAICMEPKKRFFNMLLSSNDRMEELNQVDFETSDKIYNYCFERSVK